MRDTNCDCAAPPPARGDVRGLVARVAQLREAIESEPDHCFGSNVRGGRAYGVRENLLCIVGLIESALAAEGVQAGEVSAYDLAVLDDAAETLDRLGDGSAGLRAARARIASALSQQPEARGVVDVAAVRQAVADYMRSEGCSCCRGDDHEAHAEALALLLDVPAYDDESGYDFYQFATGERNG